MAEATATPPAQPDVSKQIADLTSVVGKLATSQQSLIESIGKIATPTPAAAAAGKTGEAAPALTPEAIQKLVTDSVTAAIGSQTKTQQATAEREKFIGEKLKDLPAAYRAKLGNDPAKWKDEEQAIREEFRADFKVANPTEAGKTVGGGNAGGTPPVNTIDTSKLSPAAKFELELKKESAATAAAPAK